jgi:predicted transcriptional regulator
MITNREIENLLSGHWKSLTRTQQIDMARELMTYRKARAEYEPGWGDDPVQASIEAFVEMRIEGNK